MLDHQKNTRLNFLLVILVISIFLFIRTVVFPYVYSALKTILCSVQTPPQSPSNSPVPSPTKQELVWDTYSYNGLSFSYLTPGDISIRTKDNTKGRIGDTIYIRNNKQNIHVTLSVFDENNKDESDAYLYKTKLPLISEDTFSFAENNINAKISTYKLTGDDAHIRKNVEFVLNGDQYNIQIDSSDVSSEEQMNKIIQSIDYSGNILITKEKMHIINSMQYFKDTVHNLDIPVPNGWNLYVTGTEFEKVLLLTNAPIKGKIREDQDEYYDYIYIKIGGDSHSVCANQNCDDTDLQFQFLINEISYTPEIIHAYHWEPEVGDYRLGIFPMKDMPSIYVNVPQPNDFHVVKPILQSIKVLK